MTSSFLERFYEDVNANLDDSQTSKRISKAGKLRLLHVVEKMIWERILMLSGQESIVGRTEVTIEIENDKEFYLLPGNFRQFIVLEERTDGDSNLVTNVLRSIPLFDGGPGVVNAKTTTGENVAVNLGMQIGETFRQVDLLVVDCQ